MDYTTFINNKTLKKTVGEVLETTDKDDNKSYDKEELKDGIKDAVSIFAKPLAGKGASSAMKILDANKDGKITRDEIDNFLKKNYGISLDEAKDMTVKDLADFVQNVDENKKKNKK